MRLPWNSAGQFFGWLFVVVLLAVIVIGTYRYITREDRQFYRLRAEREKRNHGR